MDVRGVEEVQVALSRLDASIQRRIHDQLISWAESVKRDAAAKAPVRTGYLRSTIYARVREWVAEVGAEATYSACVEFGTRYMRAQPFLYPALQESLPFLVQVLNGAIEAAKREVGF